MVIETLNMSNIVEMGYVIFTTSACIKFFLKDNTASERLVQHWREELRDLEKTLRLLIGEASSASSNLDRNLLKRKTDLEKLLTKLEVLEKKFESQYILPNSSWVEDADVSPTKKNKKAEAVMPTAVSSKQNEAIELDIMLDDIVEDTKDSVNLSSKLTPAEAKSQATAKLQEISRSIATQVEKLKNIPSKQEQSAVASILDPVTLKVAKRLLSQGQEIHRVARKLELPISQVRELDRMMRNIALTSEDAETPYPAIEVVPASKIVRSKETKVEENFAPLVTAEEKVNFTDIELSRENDEKTISNFFF